MMIQSASVVALLVAAILAGPGCESLDLGRGDRESVGVPADGLLIAKLTALQHAMDNLPEEDRVFADEEYAAYGVFDREPVHQAALVKLLADRAPPVVEASELYTRSSNSQWHDGRPALKWTAAAAKSPDHPARAEVVIGWLQSRIINQFMEYTLEFDGERWNILEVELVDTDFSADFL